MNIANSLLISDPYDDDSMYVQFQKMPKDDNKKDGLRLGEEKGRERKRRGKKKVKRHMKEREKMGREQKGERKEQHCLFLAAKSIPGPEKKQVCRKTKQMLQGYG